MKYKLVALNNWNNNNYERPIVRSSCELDRICDSGIEITSDLLGFLENTTCKETTSVLLVD